MRAIRYNRHFLLLIVAMLVLRLAMDFTLPAWLNRVVFLYGLIGLLHATSLVVSLRDRTALTPTTASVSIVIAVLWRVATPILALGTVAAILALLAPEPRSSDLMFTLLFLVGSAIGSSGYWLVVRRFWLKSLRPMDSIRTVTLCVAATLLSSIAIEVLDPSGDTSNLILTAAWWFAFSISLYWNEVSGTPTSPWRRWRTHPRSV